MTVGWAKAAETSADRHDLSAAVPARATRETPGHGGAGVGHHANGGTAFAHPTAEAAQ